ncbi:MAG: hypothetical protein RLZZ129_1857 [Verrucomicrobiota bacterium]|jgi:hypothetical protein
MLVFLDESGDAGLKFTEGSSNNFVVTLVIFSNPAVAKAVDETIAKLRTKLNLPAHSEFKFAKMDQSRRERFFKEINGFDYCYFSIVINKPALRGEGFTVKESFYKYACRLVLSNAAAMLTDATVIIDGSGDREFRRQLKSYLCRTINDPGAETVRIKKLKLQDSHRNNLLQLADMICGAVARFYSQKPDHQVYRRWIRPREKRVQVWPKENPGLATEGTHTIR